MNKMIQIMVTTRESRYNLQLDHQLSRRVIDWDNYPEILQMAGKIGWKAVNKIVEQVNKARELLKTPNAERQRQQCTNSFATQ